MPNLMIYIILHNAPHSTSHCILYWTSSYFSLHITTYYIIPHTAFSSHSTLTFRLYSIYNYIAHHTSLHITINTVRLHWTFHYISHHIATLHNMLHLLITLYTWLASHNVIATLHKACYHSQYYSSLYVTSYLTPPTPSHITPQYMVALHCPTLYIAFSTTPPLNITALCSNLH